MPIPRETGKDRWSRIPKDYFRARDRLQGVKLRLSALAGVLALAWVASGVDWARPGSWRSTDLNSLRANHGTLARVHAAWDFKCDACHSPFEPIDGRPLFGSSSPAEGRAGDKLCMACHAGPAHHASAIGSEVKACAGCHRDHQGRDFSLVRLPDNDCTGCHSDLQSHLAPVPGRPPGRAFGNVTRFDKDHPAFAPEAALVVDGKLQDRGKLKFNHARHMMPGIVERPGDTPYTVGQIPLVGGRARYQGSGKLSDPVRLDCSSCHQLDPTEAANNLPNPAVASAQPSSRGPGKYYLPVTFEAQCRACHVLTFDPRREALEVPHGVQPGEVVEFLKRTYAAEVLSDDPKLLDVFVPAARVPGKSPAPATARKRLDDSVGTALTFLFPRQGDGASGGSNNCLECHHYGEVGAGGVPARVEPTNVPPVWFTHASFDHTAHRGVSCRECHPRSYATREDGSTPLPDASKVAADVLIPAIDNCKQCHAPAATQGGWFAPLAGRSTGGASHDCTECHRYHDGDRTLQGRGASTRDALAERTIVEFLKGAGAATGRLRRPSRPPLDLSDSPEGPPPAPARSPGAGPHPGEALHRCDGTSRPSAWPA